MNLWDRPNKLSQAYLGDPVQRGPVSAQNWKAQRSPVFRPEHRAVRLGENWTVFFLLILFVGVHTQLSAPAVPHAFMAFLGASGIAVCNPDRFRPTIILWFARVFLAMTIVGILSSLFGGQDADTNFRSVCNFIYDIFIGFNAYVGLTRLGIKRTRSIFFKFLIVLLVGAILEVSGIIKPISDWFREHTLTTGLYVQDERDLQDYGILRPKFFASEPAKLGETIAISFVLWFSAIKRPNIRQIVGAVFLLFLGFYFVRTPVIVFGAIAYLLIRMVTLRYRGKIGSIRSSVVLLTYDAFATALPTFFLWFLDTAKDPPKFFTTGSFFARIIAPFYMAMQTFQTNPMFGIGFVAADGDALAKLAIDAYIVTGRISTIPRVSWDTLGAMSCSALWFSFVALGIVGVIVLLAELRLLFALLRTPIALFKVTGIVCFTFWLMFGRVNSPIAWVTFFMVAAVCEMRIRNFGLRSNE